MSARPTRSRDLRTSAQLRDDGRGWVDARDLLAAISASSPVLLGRAVPEHRQVGLVADLVGGDAPGVAGGDCVTYRATVDVVGMDAEPGPIHAASVLSVSLAAQAGVPASTRVMSGALFSIAVSTKRSSRCRVQVCRAGSRFAHVVKVSHSRMAGTRASGHSPANFLIEPSRNWRCPPTAHGMFSPVTKAVCWAGTLWLGCAVGWPGRASRRSLPPTSIPTARAALPGRAAGHGAWVQCRPSPPANSRRGAGLGPHTQQAMPPITGLASS